MPFLAVRFRVNVRLFKVLSTCIFIVVMRSRPLFLCMLCVTKLGPFGTTLGVTGTNFGISVLFSYISSTGCFVL